MRTVLLLTGVALCAGAIYLLYSGARLVDANVSTGTFSLRFWEAIFWLKQPPRLEYGLADNGKSFLQLGGGGFIAYVGWRLLRAGGRFGD